MILLFYHKLFDLFFSNIPYRRLCWPISTLIGLLFSPLLFIAFLDFHLYRLLFFFYISSIFFFLFSFFLFLCIFNLFSLFFLFILFTFFFYLFLLYCFFQTSCESVWAACSDGAVRVWNGEGKPLRLLKVKREFSINYDRRLYFAFIPMIFLYW